MPSPKQTLLELKYPGDLEADVKTWVTEGKSWRWIAERVSARCGYEVSYESLRNWYGVKPEAASNLGRRATDVAS